MYYVGGGLGASNNCTLVFFCPEHMSKPTATALSPSLTHARLYFFLIHKFLLEVCQEIQSGNYNHNLYLQALKLNSLDHIEIAPASASADFNKRAN